MTDSEPARAKTGPSYTTSLCSGALSGLSVDLLFYPIDTLKTRLQSSQGFIKAGGFSGIYRGIGSVAVGSAPGAACFFVVYESIKPMLERQAGNSSDTSNNNSALGKAGGHMIAASTAEIAACLIRVPTEVIKSRQQTSSYGTKTSTFQAFKSVWREAGLSGYYRGFAGTISREIPFTCIQFPLYEYFKSYLSINFPSSSSSSSSSSSTAVSLSSSSSPSPAKSNSIPTWQAGLAGSVAGAIAAGLTTPLDVVKTRIMLDRHPAQGKVNRKIIPTLRHIFTNEGPKALFSGFVPRTLWIGLGGFVFLGTFEAGVNLYEGGR